MLAIVIPYYKFPFFKETLDSLANQTDRRFKVYIGDDASPENLLKLLEKYKSKFEFQYKRFNNNLGSISLVKQWERCVEMVGDEEWIMILGDDDVLGKNVVKSFYENLFEIENKNISVIRFSTIKINEFGNSISDVYQHPKIENAVDFLFKKTRSSLSEYIFSKKQVTTIGFKDFSLGWFSDVLAVLEFSNFKKLFSINEAIVYVRISKLSISGSQDNTKLKSKAKFEFYNYLLTQKFQCFTEFERKELFFRINKCFLNKKRKLGLFFKISKIYFHNFLIREYLSFLKLIFMNIKL